MNSFNLNSTLLAKINYPLSLIELYRSSICYRFESIPSADIAAFNNLNNVLQSYEYIIGITNCASYFFQLI